MQAHEQADIANPSPVSHEQKQNETSRKLDVKTVMNIEQVGPNHCRFVDEPEPPDKASENSIGETSKYIDIDEEVVGETNRCMRLRWFPPTNRLSLGCLFVSLFPIHLYVDHG